MYCNEIVEDENLFIVPDHNNKKCVNKNFEKVTIQFNNKWKDGKFYKNVTIEKFGSSLNGSGIRIRNAVTGGKYPHTIGSINEDMYFKVCDTSGVRNDPLILFYDNPEQYENHFFTIIDQRIKEKWYEKNLYARTKQLNN